LRIIKRNGCEVPYDCEKIRAAITAANAEVDDKISDTVIGFIVGNVEKRCEALARPVHVEEVQDMVLDELDNAEAYKLARHYSEYRLLHEQQRRMNTTDGKILSLLERNNEEAKQENANKNPIINSTLRDYMAGEVSRDICRRFLFPEDIISAHDDGIIHLHDLDYIAEPMHNCFSGATRFITDRGIRQFKEFRDGDSVYVKDLNGDLRLATIHTYGKRKMQKVTLQNCRMERTVVCTADHRWLLKDGTVTTSLKVGDVLIGLKDSTGYTINSYEEAFAFCIGFIVGDGCDHSQEGWCGQTQVRLCGRKNVYKWIFDMAGFSSYQIRENGDHLMRLRGKLKQDFLNGKGWRFMPVHLKALAFKGYYAADGAINSNRASTCDERIMEFIEETSGIAGFYISSRSTTVRDTLYKDNHKLTTYHFVKYNPVNQMWKVKSIESYNHRSKMLCYCVEEPVTHSFTLDGGIVTGNCCLVNLEDMLQNGTVVSGTMIEKPHSFSTACNIATQIIAQVASNQYGGQTISLAHLAPFVDISRQKIRAEIFEDVNCDCGCKLSDEELDHIVEKRVHREVKRGVQTIQYQINTLLTTNGQTPFVTVFMYLDEVPEGQTRDDLAMIIEETLLQRIEGVKNEKGVWITPAFPKLIYVLDEDNISSESKYYYLTELAARCTAKRMVPDYISAKVMKKLKGDVYACMGCRSFLTPSDEHKYYGRFNHGVTTINLVDVACSSGGDEDKFWQLLDERCELCFKALMCRHNRLKDTPSDVAPILWQNGALARLGNGEVIDDLLYHNYSTISLGYAGIAEMTYRMKGRSHTEPKGKEFALAVMRFLNDKCKSWREKTGISFSLYGTPMESVTYKFAQCLQRRFGIIPHVTDKSYITNSYHVHVTEPIDAFSKLKFEAEFQELSPGGAISYVEVPNLQNNIPAVLSVMEFIYENIMYAELNTKSDYCQACGFDGEIGIVEEDGKLIWKCPNCGNRDQRTMNVCRRTCGYLGTQYWNQGRTAEIKDRVMHL